jgi:hypothetical protein
MAHPGGRPPIFASPEEMQKKIDQYFNVEIEKHTLTGLALFLGFESKQSLYDYEKKPEFSYPIKRAKLMIENQIEKEVRADPHNASGIFMLKNFGWHDKQEVEHSGSVTIAQQILDAHGETNDNNVQK